MKKIVIFNLGGFVKGKRLSEETIKSIFLFCQSIFVVSTSDKIKIKISTPNKKTLISQMHLMGKQHLTSTMYKQKFK